MQGEVLIKNHRLRTPLLITHRATILVFQVLGVGLDIQNIPGIRIRLTGTGPIRTRNCLQMWQRRVEFRVIVQGPNSLLLSRGGMKRRFEDQRFLRTLRVHSLLETTMTT